MRRARTPACIVVPRRPSAACTWRPELVSYSAHRLKLGAMRAALIDETLAAHDSWEMEAHLIVPE
jgi:hypothetical protein